MNPSLEARIERLESIQEIQTLKYLYCKFCDNGYDGRKLADLFVEDAVWEGNDNERHVGRAAVFAMFENMSNEIPFAAHTVFNPIIEVDGDRATGQWWLNMPCTRRIGDQLVAHWLAGTYEETYIRTKEGWRFQHMKLDRKYWHPHLEDWGQASVRGHEG